MTQPKSTKKCPRCGVAYGEYSPTDKTSRSRDHILPQSRGGRYQVMWGDVNNIEIVCRGCNEFRDSCGNCWGAVACIDAVARDIGQTRREAYKAWKFGPAREAVVVADIAIKATVFSVRAISSTPVKSLDAVARKEQIKWAVKIGMTVHKIGVDEFIYPADTAAKRVWNLATLARGGYIGPTPRDCV